MPIYEYRCDDCGKINDVLFLNSSGGESKSIICKYCGSKKLKKLISKPAVVTVTNTHPKGSTCCGRTERCDRPPCSDDDICKRD